MHRKVVWPPCIRDVFIGSHSCCALLCALCFSAVHSRSAFHALLDELIEQSHANPGPSFGPVAVPFGEKGRSCDVQVDVWMRGETREELPSSLCAAQVAAQILDVGHIADDLLTVFIPERQSRHPLERGVARVVQLLEFGIRSRTHGHGAVGPDGATGSPGECGQREDQLRLVPLAIG